MARLRLHGTLLLYLHSSCNKSRPLNAADCLSFSTGLCSQFCTALYSFNRSPRTSNSKKIHTRLKNPWMDSMIQQENFKKYSYQRRSDYYTCLQSMRFRRIRSNMFFCPQRIKTVALGQNKIPNGFPRRICQMFQMTALFLKLFWKQEMSDRFTQARN